MALAKFRKVYGKANGGRFVVSEGIAPAEWMLPHTGLPTWYRPDLEDDRFEVVIVKGTILSVVTDVNGDSRVVPANGTAAAHVWKDDAVVSLETGATPASDSGSSLDEIEVPAKSIPMGCAQYDLYRPFDKGTSQGSGYIVRGYVEWPMIAGLNADIVAGDIVRSDHMGRPVKATPGTDPQLAVGKVYAVEKFATNFDDGLLSYMQLPSDPGPLKEVYSMLRSGPYQGKFGIRTNLDQVNAVGAFRVNLNL